MILTVCLPQAIRLCLAVPQKFFLVIVNSNKVFASLIFSTCSTVNGSCFDLLRYFLLQTSSDRLD